MVPLAAADMTNGAIGKLELTRTSPFGETPPNIVHDQAFSTGALFPIFQFRPMLETSYVIDDAILSVANCFVVRTHEIDPTVERLPRVASRNGIENAACLAARHATNERCTARIRQHKAMTTLRWWTVITLLRVLQIQSTSRILRLLVGHRLSFGPHFLYPPSAFYWNFS